MIRDESIAINTKSREEKKVEFVKLASQRGEDLSGALKAK